MHDIRKTDDDHLRWQVAELWKVGVLCGEGVELATGVIGRCQERRELECVLH